MLKKVLLGVGVLFIIFVLWSVYGLFIAEPASPPDSVSYSANGLEISVEYSRPYKKDRLIFGTEEDGALQPFDQYWRLGANAATEITFNQDVLFAGQPVDGGTYRMYALPGPDAFDIVLNDEAGVFFAFSEPDYELDVVKVSAPVTPKDNVTEQFTISFGSDSAGAMLNFDWDTYSFSVPIQAQ